MTRFRWRLNDGDNFKMLVAKPLYKGFKKNVGHGHLKLVTNATSWRLKHPSTIGPLVGLRSSEKHNLTL